LDGKSGIFIQLATRYFIKLAFQGTQYHGWQVQPNAVTVQEVLNRDLGLLLGEKIMVTGCGRTDTGVHARVFYAHFDSGQDGLAGDMDFLFRINNKLPSDIAIHEILSVKQDAHSRFSALNRTYQYHILRRKEVFNRELAHYVYGKLETDAMQEAAGILGEYSDFTSFSKVDTDVKTNDCRIMEARWEVSGRMLDFTITADRFLRNMVRAIVGTMLEIGFGKVSVREFREIIESMDRSNAGSSAPARGLFLTDVQYPPDIFSGPEPGK
jgi:tRNA pseudouridine38-40 synthase